MELTNEEKYQSQFIYEIVKMFKPAVAQFMEQMVPVDAIGVMGYLVGIIEAQNAGMGEGFDEVRKIAREIMYPFLSESAVRVTETEETDIELFLPATSKDSALITAGSGLTN